MTTEASADLHLYTRHSRRASDWALRKLDFPASYSDPRTLYDKLRKRGMRFVTFTDQNTITGCLEVADLPDVIISEEVSAAFPEDGIRASILVYGISEAQHHDIQALADNLYDLQRYLAEKQIAHAVSNPFLALHQKLGVPHVQKLALLFRHFEGINGRIPAHLSETARFALGSLKPHDIERFMSATGVEPTHDEPWRKVFIAGSDDHGGIQPARAYTVVPGARASDQFLAGVRAGRCEMRGIPGNPLVEAHGIYNVAYQYAKARFALKSKDPAVGLVEKVFSRFMEGGDPTHFSFSEKLTFLAQGIMTGKIFEIVKPGNASLWGELAKYFSEPQVKAALATATAGIDEPERRAFVMANLIASQLGYRFVTQFIEQITQGRFIDSIQTISPLVPIAGLLSPYLHAFRLPQRHLVRQMSYALCEKVPPVLKNTRRAWFTDTLEDVNGVATTIRKMTAAGVAAGHDVVVVVSRSEPVEPGIPLMNFVPVGEFELPEYELQRLSFPPIFSIIDWVARENFGEIIVSTPGPLGLVALLAGKMLGLRITGIYHTDFPQYVRILTDDAIMETLTWNYMHWFYSQLDIVYVNSEDYRRSWADRGIPAERLRILPRGLDIKFFHPSRRDTAFWSARGLRPNEIGMLYVGRISKEKNLDIIVAAARRFSKLEAPVRPLFVGDGPYLRELRRLLPDAIFTGYLRGDDLARAYASADLFVFPSTTDTFGNVVIEAQASGIPVIVSDVGGPHDLVDDQVDGFVTRAMDVDELADRIQQLCTAPALRARMGSAGRQKVESRDWSDAFEKFWSASQE